MTEDRVRTISDMLSNGGKWNDIHAFFNHFTGEYPSPSALRLAYKRATGEYKDERTRHDGKQSKIGTYAMECNGTDFHHPFYPSLGLGTKLEKTYNLEEVKKELGFSETVEKKGDTQTSEITGTKPIDLHDDRSILLFHGYDPAIWKVEWSKGSKWDAIPRKGEQAVTFYSSRVTVRPNRTVSVADIPAMIAEIEARTIPVQKQGKNNGRVLELSLSDIHLNRLSWAGNTGSNYDLHIGCDRVRNVIAQILARIGTERFDTIIVPCGGDLFNSDGSRETTTSGTPQTNDTRFGKAFKYALDLFADIIQSMRERADHIIVPGVPGNHDEDAAIMLTYALGAYFRDCSDVTVDATGLKRKYYEFGRCLLCIGHFAEDGKQLPYIIPTEAADKWGRTKYREAHGGHLHKESTVDFGGFVLRRSPSLVSPDEWTHGKGYGSGERHTSYVWHPDRGVEEIWIHHA